MPRIETGKSRLINGALLYIWEEIKTLNRSKLRALIRMASGYYRMKIEQKRIRDNRSSY